MLGWTKRRTIDIIPIRPTAALRGNAFAGFFDADLRREHVDAGYLRGLEVLGGRGWGMRHAEPAATAGHDTRSPITAGPGADPIDRDRPE